MATNGHYGRRLDYLEAMIGPGDPRLRTMAYRAAINAELDPDELYAETLRAYARFDWSRLTATEQTRVHELSERCDLLSDGGWDLTRLRSREVDELDRLIAKGLGE